MKNGKEHRRRRRERETFPSTKGLSEDARKALQAEARKLHNDGLGYRRIGAQIGVRPKIVHRWLLSGQPRPKLNAGETERVRLRGIEIQKLWSEGKSLREIQTNFGWSKEHVAQEMYRLRQKGFDLPYRNPIRKKV